MDIKTQHRSIVDKVRLSILATAVVAVVVAGSFAMISEYTTYRDGFVDNVTGFSAAIAHNLTAPIVFSDETEAQYTLDALATVPSVEQGLATDQDDRVFARYDRDLTASGESTAALSAWHPATPLPAAEIDEGVLRYARAIMLDGERVGTLYVQASLDQIYGRIKFQSLVLAGILIAAVMIAFVAGNAMQRSITVPIQQLVRAMRRVSETRAYRIRVDKRENDEVGVLVDGFNEMLGEIQTRDEQLAAANDALESQVRERTRELERANAILSTTLAEVERAKDAAEAANHAKGAFLATMSHEIRTPINGMLGNTELLLNEPLGEKARKFAEIAYQSGEALLDIINDILDFSRIEAGKLEFAESEFDLGRLVNQLCLSLSPQIRQKGLKFGIELDGAPACRVIGDPGRVRQVVSNLVTNASKFTDKGHINVRLTSTRAADGDVLARIEVEDTGIGIKGESQQLIFERFAQADSSTSRAFGGTGLGLAICKELVARMGGEIGVSSTYGKGSTFWFTLRLAASKETSGDRLEETNNRRPSGAGTFRFSVLVVDDNEINRDMARNMLEKFGCAVTTAANGKEAVEHVGLGDYRLVLMDCQMPVMDGFRATRRIRAIEAEAGRDPAFIVALTANAIKGDRDRCIQAGMNDYLAKPFKLADIHAVLDMANARMLAAIHDDVGQALLTDVLDSEAVANIRSIDTSGDDALFRRYLQIFLSGSPALIERISCSVEACDFEELTFAAHSLKSDSLAIGATALGEVARSLEEVGRRTELDGAQDLVAKLRAEFERLHPTLRELAKAS